MRFPPQNGLSDELLIGLAGGAIGAVLAVVFGQVGHGTAWWAITTVTTVGYGDSYPTTTSGRIIAVVVMLVGIGFVAILTAAAAARFTRERRTEEAAIEAAAC